MFKEQEKIDKYLANQMTEEERRSFEQEMASNPELAATVELTQEMEGFFEDYTPELEDKLTDLGKKYFPAVTSPNEGKATASRKQINKWWIILPTLLLGVMGWWIMSSKTDVTPAMESTETTNEETKLPSIEDTQNLPTEEPATIEETPSEAEETNPEQEDEPADTDSDSGTDIDNQLPVIDPNTPIASVDPAAFAPNPAFEEVVNEFVRDNKKTVVTVPAQNSNYAVADLITIKINGTTKVRPPFNLAIYSNKPKDFNNDVKIIDKTMIYRKTTDGYSFRFNAQVPLKAGLYYWTIQNNKGEMLYSDKLTVGKE